MNHSELYSSHLNDQRLIAALYMSDNQDPHLEACQLCNDRMAILEKHRLQVESCPVPDSNLSFESLNARRRAMYASLSQPISIWTRLAPPRWISAVATTIALGGGLFLYQGEHKNPSIDDHITDAQLALEVSQLSQGPEAPPTQPLQELFE